MSIKHIVSIDMESFVNSEKSFYRYADGYFLFSFLRHCKHDTARICC